MNKENLQFTSHRCWVTHDSFDGTTTNEEMYAVKAWAIYVGSIFGFEN